MTVGQISDLTYMKNQIRAHASGAAGKETRRIVSSLDVRIDMLRRGSVSEEDLAEAHLESTLGKSLGPLSDSALSALGIAIGKD